MIASTLILEDLLNIYVLEGKKDLFVKGKQLYECLQGKQQWQSWLNDRIVEHGFQAKNPIAERLALFINDYEATK